MAEFFAGLNALLLLVKEMKALFAFIQEKTKERPADVILKAAEHFRLAREAKTDEERYKAARQLGDLFSKF